MSPEGGKERGVPSDMMNVLRSRIGRGHLYAQVYLEQLLSDPHGDPDVDAEDGSCHSPPRRCQ